MILVGRIARPHGISGHVVVRPETDFVDERFRAGARLWAGSDRGHERVTIASARVHNGRAIVSFEGRSRVEDAERLAGLELRIPAEELRPLAEGSYYQHQLVGCLVDTTAGARVGEVIRVEGGAGASLLAIEGPGGEVLVPFASAICVAVDVERRRITIAPPDGLIGLNDRRGRKRREGRSMT
jgi:16S rRNA processing protein RimM